MLDPDYELFARVVDAGSLSAAGRALGISPAMASKRLAGIPAPGRIVVKSPAVMM